MANKKQKTNKASKKPVAKKASIEDLSFTDGIKSDIKEIQNLEEVLGLSQINPYGTRSTEVFEEKLSDMNLSDLQELAVTVGVFPSGTKSSLKMKLKKQFTADNRGGGGTQIIKTKQKSLDPNNPKHAETIKLMREGL